MVTVDFGNGNWRACAPQVACVLPGQGVLVINANGNQIIGPTAATGGRLAVFAYRDAGTCHADSIFAILGFDLDRNQ